MGNQQLINALLALAPYLVPVLVSILVPIVKGYMDKLPAATRARLEEIVASAVNATEQVMAPNASPSQKKFEAVKRIEDMLSQAHLKVAPSVYDTLIEQSVLLLNMAQGKRDVIAPSPCDDQETVTIPRVNAEPMFPPSGKQGAM